MPGEGARHAATVRRRPWPRTSNAGATANAIQARPIGRWERTWKWARRRPAAAAAYVLAALVLVFGVLGGSAFSLYRGAESDRKAAEVAQRDAETARGQAESARDQADVSRREADRLRLLADRQRREKEELSAGISLNHALELAEREEAGRSLLWLVRGIKTNPKDLPDMDQAFRRSLSAWAAPVHPLRHYLTHERTVQALAFSPDGKTVLTASFDSTARLWDTATGKPAGPIMRHEASIVSAAFSPDGKKLLTGGADQTARVWDSATGKPIGTPLRMAQSILSVAFDPDGKKAATGCVDGTAQMWDLESGNAVGPLLRPGPRSKAWPSTGKASCC